MPRDCKAFEIYRLRLRACFAALAFDFDFTCFLFSGCFFSGIGPVILRLGKLPWKFLISKLALEVASEIEFNAASLAIDCIAINIYASLIVLIAFIFRCENEF